MCRSTSRVLVREELSDFAQVRGALGSAVLTHRGGRIFGTRSCTSHLTRTLRRPAFKVTPHRPRRAKHPGKLLAAVRARREAAAANYQRQERTSQRI